MPPTRARLARALVPVAALLLVASLAGPAGAGAAERPRQLYVSLGDSYAVGFQPRAGGGGGATRNGFADRLPKLARARGHRLKLVNFGCGGETSTSILERKTACPAPPVGGPRSTGRTQVAAATRFLRRNRGRVGLVTVVIGGNDVTPCAQAADPVACVGDATKRVERNVGKLVRRVRAAAGRKVRIVGLTYPDVVLGRWITGQPADQDLARQSVAAFLGIINPALERSYESVRARFVDVTRATDAYVPFEQTRELAPYGTLPEAVARVCELTFVCSAGDIHLTTPGNRLVADLVARTLPRRRAS